MRGGRVIWAGLACLLMVLSSSGCVDIYGSKDLFSRRGPAAKPVFKTSTKIAIAYEFETNLAEPSTFTYSYMKAFKVKNGAAWLKVRLSLVLIPIPSVIPGNLVPERYLQIRVVMADGSVWVDARYTNSTLEEVAALNPLDGPWSVTVGAVGVGVKRLGQDSLQVLITGYEPV